LKPREVLFKIAEAAYLVKDGLHQVLFVIKGRFTEQEANAYNLLRTVIFDRDIVKYTTIVRTHFHNPFRSIPSKSEFEEDKNKLNEETGLVIDIIENCNKMLYVNNPPVDIEGDEEHIQLLKKSNWRNRENSRKHLGYLLSNCEEVYQPKSLSKLSNSIRGYMTKEEEHEYELIKEKIELAKSEVEKEENN